MDPARFRSAPATASYLSQASKSKRSRRKAVMQSARFIFLVALIFVYRFFYSRKMVGWHVGDSLEAIGCVRALWRMLCQEVF